MSKMLIWKFAVTVGPQVIVLPVGGRILSVQSQRNEPQVWVIFECDNESEIVMEARSFVCHPTGAEFYVPSHKRLNYIGTFQLHNESLVFHLFEEVDA